MRIDRPLSMVFFGKSTPSQFLWEEFFGPYPWFFTPTIGNELSLLGMRISEAFLSLRDDIHRVIPPDWVFDIGWGDWRNISQIQFKAGLSQDLVRLDKAIMCIALVNLAKEQKGVGDSYLSRQFSQIILPSTFMVDGFDRHAKDENLIRHLSIVTGQRRIVIDEVMRGYCVVEYIANDIVSECSRIGLGRIEARLLKDRRDGVTGKLVRPVSAQTFDVRRVKQFYDQSS